jgi:hypothetical protein
MAARANEPTVPAEPAGRLTAAPAVSVPAMSVPAVSVLPVSVLPVSVLPVSVLAVSVLAVSVLAVSGPLVQRRSSGPRAVAESGWDHKVEMGEVRRCRRQVVGAGYDAGAEGAPLGSELKGEIARGVHPQLADFSVRAPGYKVGCCLTAERLRLADLEPAVFDG